MTAARLPASDISEVVDVLTDAFADYPVMRFVLGAGGTGDGRLARLIKLFVSRRISLGGPMFGVRNTAGHLAAAAVMTLPAEPEPPPEVIALREHTFEVLGNDCRARHDLYAAALKPLFDIGPHHHLNMIGVRQSHQGQGLARPLLEAAIQLAAADPSSPGLTLSTETKPNVQLYEYFRFKVLGHVQVAPGLESWALFMATR